MQLAEAVPTSWSAVRIACTHTTPGKVLCNFCIGMTQSMMQMQQDNHEVKASQFAEINKEQEQLKTHQACT
jgi:hypothetical protein